MGGLVCVRQGLGGGRPRTGASPVFPRPRGRSPYLSQPREIPHIVGSLSNRAFNHLRLAASARLTGRCRWEGQFAPVVLWLALWHWAPASGQQFAKPCWRRQVDRFLAVG